MRFWIMVKYKIQLSEYGTVANRADIIIKAKNKREAEQIAIDMAENGEIEFIESSDSIDGWNYQVEDSMRVWIMVNDNYKIADKLLKMVDYSGVDVLEVAMYALTQENYHEEARLIRIMITNIENYPYVEEIQ